MTEPAAGQVRLRVEACGICHTDAASVHAHPETEPGIVPGHEVVGIIDALGDGVSGWALGDRVGVGFLGGHCGACAACRRGDFMHCADQPLTGLTVDGGYAEFMIARASGLVAIPESLESASAAPLLCAGVTTYNAIVNGGVRPGATVAIQGIGGLGHLGVQYAHHMGMRTVAIGRGTAKAEFARELGADHYVDAQDPAAAVAELNALGGADLIVATASSGASSSALIAGLATNGTLMVVGASSDPVAVSTSDLVMRGIQVRGSLTGRPIENEDNLAFVAQHGVRPLIEQAPLAETAAAYERMLSGAARFRMVLVP
ncbi:alcohol dehydrogenase [Mycetocola tolaasinivorans]|uniref:Alcohol dehydrogenase n=2 Tax=Mycetocola tolaasinivorans TaxID=76635 RepID=A0A3L7A736_9MICO|nr:alcohol dehydrogenase [Mycetocola tolaasinivorans]